MPQYLYISIKKIKKIKMFADTRDFQNQLQIISLRLKNNLTKRNYYLKSSAFSIKKNIESHHVFIKLK